ncbi:MAG TPA: SPOR domain-containing protein [Candidatus Megaira endosymbiont of Nemacystus decipiens]|nr:SPOR domain-containing protein [Candidatus Megaera endosymbiont of Nemacystus decipiens]
MIILLFMLFYSFWFSYKKEHEVVLIKADIAENKKRPQERGGIVIPNTDSFIYNKSGLDRSKIKLLPSPEDPIFIKRTSDGLIYVDSIDEILNNLEYYESLYSNDEEDDTLEEDSRILPKQISYKKKRSDDAFEADKPLDTDLIVEKSKERRFITDTFLVNTNKANKGYKLQLAVVFTEAEGKTKWQEISNKNSKFLGESSLILKRAEGDNGKVFYLVMSGIYNSFNEAQIICRRLISNRQQCIIVK